MQPCRNRLHTLAASSVKSLRSSRLLLRLEQGQRDARNKLDGDISISRMAQEECRIFRALVSIGRPRIAPLVHVPSHRQRPGSCCVDPNSRRWKLRWRAVRAPPALPSHICAREQAPRRDDTAATLTLCKFRVRSSILLRCVSARNPVDAIDMLDTVVDAVITRWAAPTVAPSAMPGRTGPYGPHASMRSSECCSENPPQKAS